MERDKKIIYIYSNLIKMAVSPPVLSISLTRNSTCTSLLLADTTGEYGVDGNTTGYGLPSGPSINDITTVTIVVTYNSLPTTLTYVFTITSGVISTCTLQIASGTPVSITSNLTNTAWPFTASDTFDLFDDYGVTIPAFTDDIYTVSYKIEGTTPDVFDFETEDTSVVLCASQLCVNQRFASLDWSCECSSTKAKQAMQGQSLIYQVSSSVALGDLSVALSSLEDLKRLCDTSAGGCGCS